MGEGPVGPGSVVGGAVGSGSVPVGSGPVGSGLVGPGSVGGGEVGVGSGFVGVGGGGEVGLVPQPVAAADAQPVTAGSRSARRSADSTMRAVSAARRGTAADVTPAIVHHRTPARPRA